MSCRLPWLGQQSQLSSTPTTVTVAVLPVAITRTISFCFNIAPHFITSLTCGYAIRNSPGSILSGFLRKDWYLYPFSVKGKTSKAGAPEGTPAYRLLAVDPLAVPGLGSTVPVVLVHLRVVLPMDDVEFVGRRFLLLGEFLLFRHGFVAHTAPPFASCGKPSTEQFPRYSPV